MQYIRSKDIAFYCFDGFLDILANNLQTLFEGEHAGLKAVFQLHSTDADEIRNLVRDYYSELLKTLFWRSKFGEKNGYNPVGDFNKWQKLIPFEDVNVFK